MIMENFNELAAFALVASEKSFTRAAAKMGISQSALSQTIRNLEARLELRLLTRTTRSVSPTEAGEYLLSNLAPRLDEITGVLNSLRGMRDKPTGTVRIAAAGHPAVAVIEPALRQMLRDNPDVNVEISVDDALADIVADGFDAGVRLGEQVAKDMIAVRISPDIRMVVVASPDYFSRYPLPLTPHDLTHHNCINLRLPTYGGLFPWEFAKNGEELKVRVEGQLTFNSLELRLNAVRAGCGLTCLPEDTVADDIRQGRLIQVLDEWCPLLPGYHLYYPHRRHPAPAFTLVLNALREHWRNGI
ncbi:LysR family transcriptional regulator [Pantoea cypripedii]|uniref:LysR family transcriptional regulator n=1 Tax=Pantoea cypripedii TaxID=55209 RepID=UPI002FC7FC7A